MTFDAPLEACKEFINTPSAQCWDNKWPNVLDTANWRMIAMLLIKYAPA